MKIECAFKFLVLDRIFKARLIIILLDIKSSNRIHFKDYFLILDNEVIFFPPRKAIKIRDTPLSMMLQN